MAERLTDARVRATKPREKRYSIMHAGEPGLELRVSPDGKKVFALRASVESRDVRFRIGEYGQEPPRVTLAEAERRAREIKARLDREGDFRATERDQREAEKVRRAFTVGMLADAWLKEQAKQVRASTLRLQRQQIASHVRPRFGDRPLDDVSRADVRAAMTEIAEKHPRTANAVRQLISALYQFANNELERECANPASGMRAYRLKSRERVLSDTELKVFWEGLEDPAKPPGPVVALALKIALYGAQRASEITGARDDEINEAELLWTVPGSRTKSGKPNVVPLTPRLLQWLRQAQALRGPSEAADALVFDITRHAMTRGMARLVDKLGTNEAPFASASPHDLRRTARTLLSRERLGVSYDDAERLLSHATGSSLSRVYDRHDYLPQKRRALLALEGEIDRIIAGKPVALPVNVVNIRDAI
jgi:integrase